jgi:hypothetical protein
MVAILQRLRIHPQGAVAAEQMAQRVALAVAVRNQALAAQVTRHLPPPRREVTEATVLLLVLVKVVLAVAVLPMLV